jgi:Txe/YoeB family toxin of toxin-antitoxin system
MPSWALFFTKDAEKDAKRLKQAGLKEKAGNLLEVIKQNHFHNPPPYEKLVGDLQGLYSRHITIKHRLVYQVLQDEQAVKVLRMWTHYE